MQTLENVRLMARYMHEKSLFRQSVARDSLKEPLSMQILFIGCATLARGFLSRLPTQRLHQTALLFRLISR